MERPVPILQQTLVGAGVLVLAAFMAAGATQVSSEAGYSGVGPNFLPWVVTAALALCGAWIVWEARTGGFRDAEEPSGAEHGDWTAFAWATAGLLANAFLITRVGFIASCTICFVLAARGLRISEGRRTDLRATGGDLLMGAAIAAPVFWMFTKLLSINLPGLTASGWL
jgi:putative tricarboxylic transport membrane protein